jgi:hypothetical protein
MTRDGGFSKMVTAGREAHEKPSTNRFYCFFDERGIVLFGERPTFPSREQMIEDEMRLARHMPTRDSRGWSLMGEPRYATREEAERNVDSYLSGIRGGDTE